MPCLACLIFVLGSAIQASGVVTHGDKKLSVITHLDKKLSSGVAGNRSNTSWPWSKANEANLKDLKESMDSFDDWDKWSVTASLDELVNAVNGKENPLNIPGQPVMQGIKFMRAQVCAEMFKKHAEDYSAFAKCKSFMNEYCNPGKDQVMNGEKGERPTGQGVCKMFFSGRTLTGSIADEIGGRILDKLKKIGGKKGNYDQHAGKTLGHIIEGHSDWRGDPDEAWEKCEALGDACAGFTCNSEGKSCSVRSPGPLRDSDNGEISFVKPGADLSDTQGQEGGSGGDGGSGGSGGSGGDSQVQYKLRKGQVLIPGPISSHPGEYNYKHAKELCSALPASECAGITCLDLQTRCTLRGGPGATMVLGKNGEFTYVRSDAVVGDGGENKITYKLYDGKVLDRPVPDGQSGAPVAKGSDATFESVTAAESFCDELPGCAGITCDKTDKDCTLHGLGDLKESQSGEKTYLKGSLTGGGRSGAWTMDTSDGLPEQGYYGRDVLHSDQETHTKDWLAEHSQKDLKKTESDGCDAPNAPTVWCKTREEARQREKKANGQLRSGRSTAASSQMSFMLLALIAAVNLR